MNSLGVQHDLAINPFKTPRQPTESWVATVSTGIILTEKELTQFSKTAICFCGADFDPQVQGQPLRNDNVTAGRRIEPPVSIHGIAPAKGHKL
jgi:hypothetical protein